MKTDELNWPSQRNKRRWAIVWLTFIFIVVLITSCSIQPRYHNRGFQISLANHHAQNHQSLKSTHRTKTIAQAESSDTTRAMHIPENIIAAGRDQRWVYHFRISDSLTKPLRTMTIVGDTFLMHGKLVAANETGIFLYNPHDPLFWVAKGPYGKRQSAIREHILYMPYKDIQKIRLGGTVASRLERLLEKAFKVLFWTIGIIGTLLGIVVADNTLNLKSAGELIFIIALILAFIAALIATVVLSAILAPFVFLMQASVSRFKGRFWAINKNPSKGKAFFEFIKSHSERYRLFKD